MADADRSPQAQIRRNRRVQAALAAGIVAVVAVVVVALLATGKKAGDGSSTTPGGGAPSTGKALAQLSFADGLQGWKATQQPTGQQRITAAPAPEGDGPRPDSDVMRVQLEPGDRTDTGGYIASRAEVYGRIEQRGVDPKRWPDPVGSTRWYAYSLFMPKDFCLSPESSHWLTITQWKGLNGGSPPIAIEVKRGMLELGGRHGNDPLGPVSLGKWTRLVIGLHLSPDPKEGWVEVLRDGRTVVPRRSGATMDAYVRDGKPRVDPIYLKQGIYRSEAWTCSQEAFFGPTTVATSAQVAQAGS